MEAQAAAPAGPDSADGSATLWRVCTGPGPGPCSPDSCAWSDDDFIALGCETTLRVVPAGSQSIACRMHAQEVLEASDKALLAAGSSTRKRARDANSGPDSVYCPPQLSSQPFVAISWAPLAASPSRGCMLCVAAGHATAVYARGSAPMSLRMEPVVQLAPLLHGALGHAASMAEAERAAVTVHSSHWTPLLAWRRGSGSVRGSAPASSADVRAPGHACYLALAGPRLLAVIAFFADAPSDAWRVALRIDDGGSAGATVARFGKPEGERELHSDAHDAQDGASGDARAGAVSTVGELLLFSGASDGSVFVRLLVPVPSPPAAAGEAPAAYGARLECRAARRVGSERAITRGVCSLSVALVPSADLGGPPACVVLIGSGPFVLLYRLEGGSAALEAADARASVGTIVHRAAHASEITSVLVAGGTWYSAAKDGTLRHGRVGGALGDEFIDYPLTARLSAKASAHVERDQREQRRAMGVVDAPKELVGEWSHGKRPAQRLAGATEAERDAEPEAQSRSIFGLALSPTGASVAICLRVSRETHSKRETGRTDNWRLLLATPPPSTLPPLRRAQSTQLPQPNEGTRAEPQV